MFSGEHTEFLSHACSFSWSSDKLRTGMPKDSALVNLLPALSPASKKAVFWRRCWLPFPVALDQLRGFFPAHIWQCSRDDNGLPGKGQVLLGKRYNILLHIDTGVL